MIRSYKAMIKNYANFNGRTSRGDFWLSYIMYFILSMVFTLPTIIELIINLEQIDAIREVNQKTITISPTVSSIIGILFIIGMIFQLFNIIPLLSIRVRRLHDTNKSGWFILLYLLGGIGEIILFVFYCLPSVDVSNMYGNEQV